MTAVNRGTALEQCQDALARTRESLERYEGTPCEQDYRAMVERYELRAAELAGGRRFVGAACTLDGQPATIAGRRNAFATVATLPTGPAYEYAWQTVAHVMTEKEGRFHS